MFFIEGMDHSSVHIAFVFEIISVKFCFWCKYYFVDLWPITFVKLCRVTDMRYIFSFLELEDYLSVSFIIFCAIG